ncbi:MAG: hypothetical protein K2O67_01315, partial [Clostridia bacterium]|nr:hypothetical protein [Clostridia bacterium]
MFKSKSKKLLLGILLCLCAAFFALLSAVSQKAYGYISCENDYGGSINIPTAANAIGNIVSSIDDKGNVKFDKTNLKALAKKGGYDSLDKMVKAAEGGEIKTSTDFGDTVVNFGSYEFEGTKYELTWIPVYLSQSDVDLNGDKKNDAILTLWLACTEATNGTVSNQEVSTWTDGTYSDQETNPSANNYSTSYIRVKTLNNGGTYYGSYTMWSTKAPTAYDYTATSDGSNKFEIVTTGALSGYIVTPSAVSWQKNANYTKNDPLWNGDSKGYYTQDGWLNDNIWLPSIYEVYDNTLQSNGTSDSYKQNGGLWQTGINSDSGKHKRSNSDYTWWRSAPAAIFQGVYKGGYNGSGATSFALNKTPAAVRPALHLNISLLDPCEHTNLTAHAKETYCDKQGHEAYWECSDCGGLFSDAAAQTPIDEIVKVAALGHSKTPHAAQAATCTTDGNVAYWSCSNCNKNLDANDNVLNSVVVTKTGHSMTSVSGVAVTCTSDGKVAHYHC